MASTSARSTNSLTRSPCPTHSYGDLLSPDYNQCADMRRVVQIAVANGVCTNYVAKLTGDQADNEASLKPNITLFLKHDPASLNREFNSIQSLRSSKRVVLCVLSHLDKQLHVVICGMVEWRNETQTMVTTLVVNAFCMRRTRLPTNTDSLPSACFLGWMKLGYWVTTAVRQDYFLRHFSVAFSPHASHPKHDPTDPY